MSEKIRHYLESLSVSVVLLIFAIIFTVAQNTTIYAVGFYISFLIFICMSTFIFIKTEDIKHLRDLNKESSKEEIENAVENVFINDILSYASSRGLNPSVDFAGQDGLYLQEEVDGVPIRVCEITIPDESSKVGDDLYNYTLESAKEKIEKYIKNNKVEKAEENKW